jgi:hypothetical protein
MATAVSGSNYSSPTSLLATIGPVPGDDLKFGGRVAVKYFRMRAVDANAATSPPTYRTWTVKNDPDYTGAQYTGQYSGASPNLTSIVIQDTIEVEE